MDTFFHYTKLEPMFIRLIIVQPVHPDSPAAPLEVSLIEQHLDQGNYNALSYVWGKSCNKCRIVCNGGSVDIGENLYEALLEYRRRRIRRALWADAICINQEDNVEKTEQVRLMRHIYQSATYTIIWLGSLLPGDDMGLEFSKLVYQKCKQLYPTPGTDNSNLDFHFSDKAIPHVSEGRGINEKWESLFRLLSHPWFGRVWVIQELVLSPASSFWRGAETIGVHVLLWLAYQVQQRRNLQTKFASIYHFNEVPAFGGITHFYFNSSLHGRSRIAPLWINVFNSLGMNATDMRDRFFAITAMSSNLPTDFIDYSKPLGCIVSQVMLLWLTDHGSRPTTEALDFLAHCPSTPLRRKGIMLPSWTLDFFFRAASWSLVYASLFNDNISTAT